MVVIKQYSDTQIASLNSITGRVLYDSTINALRYNDSSSYNNILLFKDSSNNVSGLNNVRTSGNFGINTSSADKQAEINSATGDCLRLTYNDNNGSAANYTDFLVSSTGNLTVTPSGGDITLDSNVLVNDNLSVTGPILSIPTGNTAARPAAPQVGYIRYNTQTSQFEGYGAGNAWGSLGGVSDVDQNTKILAEDGAGTNDNNLRFFNDGNESMRLTATSLLGLGTTSPDKKLEINSATGDCLRLTYDDSNGSASNYVDLLVSSGGDFNITPSGNDTTFNSTMTITGATTLSDTLGVTGATTLSSTLGVTGATTLSSTLDVTGVINFNDTTDATSSTAGGCLTIDGGAAVAKKLFVGTDLSIGGNSTLTGTLGVTGATTLSSTLGVTGATTLSDTLGVTGATTLSSSLSATGVITFSDTTDATSSTAGGCVTISGGTAIAKKLFVGTDLSIGGNSTMAGTLGVTGATTLSSTLGVTGATTLSSTLGVTGATTLSSTLGVTSATTLLSTLGVNGTVSFSDTTDATSSTAGGCLTVSGGAAIAKKLFVGTNLSVGGNSTLTGTLGVTGGTTLSSTLGVTGATTLSSTLGVTGATTLSSTLSATGVITFSNTTDATSSTAGGCVTISGGTAIAKKLFVGTDLSIGGNSTLTGTLGVTGATTLSSTLGVTGATTLSSTLGVTGATTLSSTLSATGAITFSNTTDATSSTAGGCVTISGGTAIAKKLFVGTDLSIGGNSTLTGTLGVTGATTLSSTLAVTGNSVLTGSLGVGTSAPDKKVEINSATGDCLRLTYDDADGTATNYTDLLVSSTGNLTLTPSGGDVNISSHNGSTTGLKLNNVLVTSTAAELNYNDTTVGIGAANKAVILDSSRNYVNINYLEVDELAVIKSNTANNTVVYPVSLYAVPSTSPVVGLGTGIEFNSVNDTDQIYNAAYINYVSSDITTESETGFLDFKVANSGSINSVATISNNGVLSVTSLVETSDVRSKENIQETVSNDSLEKILNVNVKTYNYIKDSEKTHRIGVIAQEIKEIIPESVVISKNEDFEDFHQVQYTALVPHLINCIKALSEEIKELKAKLN
jgi:hypothetical protein